VKFADARERLRQWAADLEAIRPFTDEVTPETRPEIHAAWQAAYTKFRAACDEYCKAIEAGDGPRT
jgi:hypothetical protein